MSKTAQIDRVVHYNFQKLDEGKASLLDSWRIPARDDPWGRPGRKDVAAALHDRAALNARVRLSVTHISLNPDPDDKPSDELLAEMGKTLLDRLGYGDQPYVLVKHADISREHLHIIVSNIDPSGKKIRDTFEHRHCDRIRKELEAEFHLRPAQGRDRKPVRARTTGREASALLKKKLEAVARYRFADFQDFRTLAELAGIRVVQTRSGEGHEGLAFALYGGNDASLPSPPIPAARLGDAFSRKAIEKQAAGNDGILKDYAAKGGLRRIMAALQDCGDQEQLHAKASALGITLLFRRTVTGRIYACTVIDHKRKAVLPASRIHRGLSAAHWQKFFPDEPGPDLRPGSAIVLGRSPDSILGKKDKISPTTEAKAQARPGRASRPMGGTAPPAPFPPTAAPVPRQEKANTAYKGDEEEEEAEERRKRRRRIE